MDSMMLLGQIAPRFDHSHFSLQHSQQEGKENMGIDGCVVYVVYNIVN
jgi:hypothetical protein